MYGCENLCLNKRELNDMQRTESSIVKNMIGKCRSTALLTALKIDKFMFKYETIKASFLIRLLNNELTEPIVLDEIRNGRFYLNEYIENDRPIEWLNKDNIIIKCSELIRSNEFDLRYKFKNDEETRRIYKLFNQHKAEVLQKKLYETLKFG